MTVTNLTDAAVALPVKVDDVRGGGGFAASTAKVSLAAGESATISVTFTSPKKADTGPAQAHLLVGDAHAVLFAWLK